MTFKPHEKTTVPPLDTVIWRYVDLAKFMSMLESRSLYFTSIAVLAREDQWEGVFHRELREMWREVAGTDNLESSRQYLMERAFVNCWYMSEHESDAMWKVYSQGSRNVAIRSTFGKLRDTLGSCAEPIHVGQVEYIDRGSYDYKTKMVDASAGAVVLNITPVLLWKRPSYSHERELRTFYYTGSPARGPKTPGMPMFVDLNLLFDEIRVSPRSEPWFRELVEQIMSRYGFGHVPVRRSSMDDDPEV
jgi:hypothetical protein